MQRNFSSSSSTSNDAIFLVLGLLGLCLLSVVRRNLDKSKQIRSYLLIGLTTLAALGLSLLIIKLILKIRGRLRPEAWDKMSGLAFEDQVMSWLKRCGYTRVKKTEYFDKGLDIIAKKDGLLIGIQVKRSSKSVGVAAVRAAVTALRSYGCHQAMVITNAKFTSAASDLARANDCRLIDGEAMKKQIDRSD